MADGDDPIPLADEDESSVPVMDEDESPSPRSAKPSLNQPLPRIWKVDPEPEEAEAPTRKSRRERLAEEKAAREEAGDAAAARKAKAKGKASKDGAKPPPGKVLIEATPESETYDARRRARLIIGGVMFGVVALGIYLIYKAAVGQSTPPPVADAGGLAPPVTTSRPPAANEQEAKILLGTAQQLAKNGNTQGAIGVLEKIVKNYPKTSTAAEAQEALGRPAKNLPLFLDRPTVVADTKAATRTTAPSAPVVNAVPPTAPVRPGSTSIARVDLAPNAPEAGRAPPVGPAPNATTVPPKSIPSGFRPVTEAGAHASGWPNQIVSDRDGAVMVLIPAGTYIQGRNNGTLEEAPEHKVTLAAYYIDQHEVTVRQYNLYLKETGGKPLPAVGRAKDDDEMPVGNVTVKDALAYLKWAGKRLPTEAQWEAAARTTDGRPHPWGADAPKWNHPRVPRQIDPVMSFPQDQSPYGVFDMAGNAQEFTNDWYDPNYYFQFKGRSAENPMGPNDPPRKPAQVVVKGTSKTWFVAAREGLKTDTKFPFVGFRGALPVESGPSTPNGPGSNAPGSLPTTPGGITPF